jgi:hypothetical protein
MNKLSSPPGYLGRYGNSMQPGQPYNIAVAEVEHNGSIGRITGTAATERDDAIQFIVNLMEQDGIGGHAVLRLYSERKPSVAWYEYFAEHWPNADITWSFGPNEDDKMQKAIDRLLPNREQPWWKFW